MYRSTRCGFCPLKKVSIPTTTVFTILTSWSRWSLFFFFFRIMYLFIELHKNHINYSNTWFPNLFGTRDWLHGRHRPGVGGWFREDSNALHLLCALFLLLLHQLYLRSSGIRSWRLETPFLMYTNILLWCLSLTKSCPTVCNSMYSSVRGFPVLHHLPEFAHTLLMSDLKNSIYFMHAIRICFMNWGLYLSSWEQWHSRSLLFHQEFARFLSIVL